MIILQIYMGTATRRPSQFTKPRARDGLFQFVGIGEGKQFEMSHKMEAIALLPFNILHELFQVFSRIIKLFLDGDIQGRLAIAILF
jgi:hypothetical protein